MEVAGIVLAAGAGRRYGRPKGLVRDDAGRAWVALAVEALVAGGCAPVLVVTGAAADEVASLVPEPAHVVRAPDWASGMSASLRAALQAVAGVDAAVVTLVDIPGVTATAVARLVALAAPDVLARATYSGRPGHPTLLGAQHFAGVLTAAVGDQGARAYLAGRDDVRLVECGDVADGTDVDTPAEITD
ncbi:NTP transferase domain-containing protein [Spongisporangium articulatum]|uniref:NTP transferase domain-containing protein n=1 Tax=Spongisporangium articulatum TaxID=3362603 RepID=A0ABW8AJG1_9ACTN